MKVTNASLHYQLIKGIIDHGYAPSNESLANILEVQQQDIIDGLYRLEAYHGVVLHPNEPKVWVVHPFSLSPTNFYVKSARGEWWGNCAWCSLGIAAILNQDVSIITTLGAETNQIAIRIENGQLV